MSQILISADETSTTVRNLLKTFGIPYEVAPISFDLGDYIIGGYLDSENKPHGSIVVERTTLGDFWEKLKSGRGNNQMVDLSYNFQLSVWAIIGYLEYGLPEQAQIAYASSMTSLIAGLVSAMWKKCNQGVEGNIAVVNFATENLFVLFLKELLDVCDIQDPRIPKMERLSRKSEWQYLFWLQSIQGIGEQLSRSIMFAFPTPYDLVTATAEKIQEKVEGIGSSKSNKLYQFFRTANNPMF